jgi:immune inhibitor A
MTRDVTLPAGTVTLSAKVRYEIEQDFDYAYLTINGAPVATNLSSGTDPNGNNPSLNGITGSSGGNWVDLTADLSAFAGQTVTLGFEYKTDPAVAESGFGVDDIAITGLPTDDAETDPGWSYNGFIRTTSTIVQSFPNYYVAEYRQYVGYDDSLRTGPYNFGFLDNPNLQITTSVIIAQMGVVAASSCPWTHILIFCFVRTMARCGARASSPMIRPSGSIRPTGFVCMPIASNNATVT